VTLACYVQIGYFQNRHFSSDQMVRRIDLHVHTVASEGSLTVSNHFAYAAGNGLRTIALTDRDVLPDGEEAHALSERYGVEYLPGVEVTGGWNGQEVHILGYRVDSSHPRLAALVGSVRTSRQAHLDIMLYRLAQAGVFISRADITRQAPLCECPGRVHIARAMVERGCIQNVREAYVPRYIGIDGDCYHPSTAVPAEEVIRTVLAAGGIPVLAHPGIAARGLGLAEQDVAAMRECGLRGIEVIHACHSPEQSLAYDRMAGRLGLLRTGGSCCRGDNHSPVLQFRVSVPEEYLAGLCRSAAAA
jgi:predicted metal-dependent phosphoesterase TrpH